MDMMKFFRGAKSAWNPIGSTVRPTYLGVGFIWAWIYCSFFTGALGLKGSVLAISWFQTAAAVLMTISLFAVGVWLRKRDLISSTGTIVGSALLMAVGTSIAFVAGGKSAVGFASGAVTGIGCAVQCVLWGQALSCIEDDTAEFCIPAASLIPALAAFLVPALVGAVGAVVTVCLPLLSALCLIISRLSFNGQGISLQNGRIRSAKLLFVPCILIVSYLVLCHISSTVSTAYATESMPFDVPSFLGAGSGIILAFCFVLFSPEIGFGMLYRWLFPVLMLGLGALPWLNDVTVLFVSAISSAADMCIQALAILFLIRLAKRQNLSVVLVIGLGQGFIQLGTLLGYGLEFASPFLSTPTAFQSIVLMVLLSMAVALIPRHNADIAYIAQVPTSNADDEGDEFRQAMARLTETYGLSSREAEIAELLAHGRSQPYIRETLYLSKGTVATHVKYIYRKLDVHSKQELIDLVEHEQAANSTM